MMRTMEYFKLRSITKVTVVLKSILVWDVFIRNTVNQIEKSTKIMEINEFIIHFQSECIEKYQFKLCSKYDREYGFAVILG